MEAFDTSQVFDYERRTLPSTGRKRILLQLLRVLEGGSSRMITLKEAFELKPGEVLHEHDVKNSRGQCRRWKVNGQVKTWKRDRGRIYVPLKHGLRSYGAITETDFVNGKCNLLTLASKCRCGNPY
jgi:hypothetical protein